MGSTGTHVDNTGSIINLLYRFVKYDNYFTFLHGMFLNLCITILFTAKPYPYAKYLMETILQGSVYAYFGFTIWFIQSVTVILIMNLGNMEVQITWSNWKVIEEVKIR